jgi:hypothetical protein
MGFSCLFVNGLPEFACAICLRQMNRNKVQQGSIALREATLILKREAVEVRCGASRVMMHARRNITKHSRSRCVLRRIGSVGERGDRRQPGIGAFPSARN